MKELADGRATRLTRIIDIIEACQEMGERLDLDTISEVLDAQEAELAKFASQVPAGIRSLSLEEKSVALALLVVGGALESSVAFMEQRSGMFKFRNELRQIRNQLQKTLWQHMFARIPTAEAVTLSNEATAWRFLMLSPDETSNLVDMVQHLSQGGRGNKPQQDQARRIWPAVSKLQRLTPKESG